MMVDESRNNAHQEIEITSRKQKRAFTVNYYVQTCQSKVVVALSGVNDCSLLTSLNRQLLAEFKVLKLVGAYVPHYQGMLG